jgi:prepilin-type N-terminal cleavage/methylation domain-containing protein
MRKDNKHISSAFTMIELIFVIIVLGIVSSIGASLIARVYESYIMQNALHHASTKTDLAVKQIAARLTNRISLSVIGKKTNTDFLPISQITPADTGYDILEWIGYDNDSFSTRTSAANPVPAWSGFCDIDASTKTSLSTPASNLNLVKTIIGNLGSDNPSADPAVIFNARFYAPVTPYLAAHMGYTDTATISPVSALTGTTLTITDNNPKTLYDQYKLAWSAYAIVPVQQADRPETSVDESKLFRLDLHYNYQPWKGMQYDNVATKVSTLVEDVTVFNFVGQAGTIRFKLCVQEKISNSETVNICKEKVVIR